SSESVPPLRSARPFFTRSPPGRMSNGTLSGLFMFADEAGDSAFKVGHIDRRIADHVSLNAPTKTQQSSGTHFAELHECPSIGHIGRVASQELRKCLTIKIVMKEVDVSHANDEFAA